MRLDLNAEEARALEEAVAIARDEYGYKQERRNEVWQTIHERLEALIGLGQGPRRSDK